LRGVAADASRFQGATRTDGGLQADHCGFALFPPAHELTLHASLDAVVDRCMWRLLFEAL
jgi:hypothetical protein